MEDNAKAASGFLAALTVPRVALGIAFAAGALLLWHHFQSPTADDRLLVIEIGLGAILLSIGAAVWAKIEGIWKDRAEDLETRVKALTADVAVLHAQIEEMAAERAEMKAQLAACLERDKQNVSRIAKVNERLDAQERHSDFGGLPL